MKKSLAKKPALVLTIGHSTRPLAEFLLLLQTHQVTRLVDVRTIPRSRHNPQFNQESLPAALRAAGLSYQHMAGLGGLRPAQPDSCNTAWHNASFRGFADYMQTREFGESLQALIDLAQTQRVALMCAEALPWRCHRSLIADALMARGLAVQHIMSLTQCRPHAPRPWALVKGGHVTYPGSELIKPSKIRARKPSSIRKGDIPMAQKFKVGDHVTWNSEAGRVRGTVKKQLTSPTRFKGYTVRASKEEPQYLIKSDKTDHLAMHKGSALRIISKTKR